VKNLSKDKDGLLVSNASLAEYNLSLEPKLISARQQLADVYTKAVELQKEHERNMMRLGLCICLSWAEWPNIVSAVFCLLTK